MKHLCLDIGNVLVNLNMEPFAKALSKQMNLSKEETWHFINRIQKKQDVGLTSIRDEMCVHFDIKSEYILDDLIEAWHSIVVPNRQSIDFMNKLVIDDNIQIALLSNIGYEHVSYFDNILSNEPVYTKSIHHFSCDVGARKPTSIYYKIFLDEHPEFRGALYLDDLLENLATGSKMGFQTMLWDLSKYDVGKLPFHFFHNVLNFFDISI